MVLDPMSLHARGCGPFDGLLRTPSAETQKKEEVCVIGIFHSRVQSLAVPPLGVLCFSPSNKRGQVLP